MAEQNQETTSQQQEKVKAEDTTDSNGEEPQTDEESTQQKEEVEANFLVIRGHYKYGGRNKTYGIFELIGEQDAAKFSYVDLGSSSNDELYELFLELSNQDFRDNLQQLVEVGNQQDQNISKKMRKELSAVEIVEILAEGKEEQLQKLIRENIEDEIQEEIELELNWGFLSQAELLEIYPERFQAEQKNAGDDLDAEESKEGLSDYEGEESGSGLNIDMKLNCEPVISAISGKLIASFDVGDEILVRITDKRELSGDLENKIKVSNGLGVGTIEKINYKEEIDRYNVLVELGDKIYGQLTVGPKVMLSYPEAKGDVAASDLKGEDSQNSTNNNDLGVVMTIVGLFIVIVILILLYL